MIPNRGMILPTVRTVTAATVVLAVIVGWTASYRAPVNLFWHRRVHGWKLDGRPIEPASTHLSPLEFRRLRLWKDWLRFRNADGRIEFSRVQFVETPNTLIPKMAPMVIRATQLRL